LALQEYLTDNHAYPLYAKLHSDAVMWESALQKYEDSPNDTHTFSQLVQQGVWVCPGAKWPANLPPEHIYISYGYNLQGMSAKIDTNSLGLGGHFIQSGLPQPFFAPPIKESEIANPSEMMAIGDGLFGGNGVIENGDFLWRTYSAKDYLDSTKRSYARHEGKANVVFCDGHIESPTLQFLFTDTSDAALSAWNRDHQPHRERLSP